MTTTAWKDRPIEYKIANNMRCRLNMAIKTGAKAGSAVRDLGCSIEEFMLYIEQQFLSGMSWDNWGREGWHLDHIIPLSRFDLSDRKQFLKANHYTNYQPMWAKDNLCKSDKFNKDIVFNIIDKRKTRSRIDRDKLQSLLQKGLSLTKISKELGCSVCKVRYWAEKLGLRKRITL